MFYSAEGYGDTITSLESSIKKVYLSKAMNYAAKEHALVLGGALLPTSARLGPDPESQGSQMQCLCSAFTGLDPCHMSINQ